MINYILPFLEENRTVILFCVLGLLNELFEYWIGKTSKVEAGSKLELLFLFIKKVKNVFKK